MPGTWREATRDQAWLACLTQKDESSKLKKTNLRYYKTVNDPRGRSRHHSKVYRINVRTGGSLDLAHQHMPTINRA